MSGERPATWRSADALAGQVAVVTGGSSGIGLALVGALADAGCSVVAAARNAARLQTVCAGIERVACFGDCDVRSASDIARLFAFVDDRFGRIDIAVVNAGIGHPRPDLLLNVGEADWDAVVDTNLRGAFLTSRAALVRMVPRRAGQILNISSARGALRGVACGAAYSASKMAVRALFESMAAEVAAFGIRVASLLPDAVDTPLIAGTRLAPRGSLQPTSVAHAVLSLLTLPQDAALENPLLMPFSSSVPALAH